jgi:putative peptidoglycan lipid II flippase
MFPDLVKNYATGDRERMRELLLKAIRFVCFIFLPVTVIVFISGESLVTIFFKRGAFDAHAVGNTVIALRFFTLGMLALALNAVMRSAFFSMQDSATPLKIGILSFTVNVTFDIIFIRFFGFGGIALSSSLAAVINAIVLYRLLVKKKVFENSAPDLFAFLGKVVFASSVMGGVMWALEVFVKTSLVAGPGKARLAAFFGGNILIGVIIYMLICLVLRVAEYRAVLSLFGKAFRKGARLAHLSI